LTAASRTACRALAVEWEKEPVGTAGKCPSVYVTAIGDDEEAHALVNSPTTTTRNTAVRRAVLTIS
jgi:hypothetical protein